MTHNMKLPQGMRWGGNYRDSEGELIIKVRSGISRVPASDPEITQSDQLHLQGWPLRQLFGGLAVPTVKE